MTLILVYNSQGVVVLVVFYIEFGMSTLVLCDEGRG